MKKTILGGLVAFFLMVGSGIAEAADRTGYDELTAIMDSAKVKEAGVFSPKTWEKAVKKYAEATRSFDLGKNQKTIDKYVAESREYAENALKAAEVGKLSLQEYQAPRDKARAAKAHTLVPVLYGKAEAQFLKATAKVESGDVKNALKEADKATPLFDVAELEAVRAEVLGAADKLIAKAVADDAGKFALSTLDKARTARTRANAILTSDRYNRTESVAEATRAEYEARHSSNIGLSVRSLNRNDQAWEKLMLGYEIQMNRVGQAAEMEHLPFDEGALAAADALIHYIESVRSDRERVSGQMGDIFSEVSKQLKSTLDRLEVTTDEENPVALAKMVDQRLSDLLVEKAGLAEQVQSSQTQLTELSQAHEGISEELSVRKEREDKFRTAKQVLNPSEGEVLFNSSNDIVLRLSGLSFDVGKSDIKDDHMELLRKIQSVIEMFPTSQLVVEGHTDDRGEASSNVTLSEKRAFAVMQYLRQAMLIPAERIQSIGFGADRPVASNKTSDGRAKNRRIDIIIMH
ncbi:MAG: OmpA family protein [bacterium]|nr:OmpA family protein [bacterium]